MNNTQIDNAKELYVVMPMYNLIEYSDNYSKTTRTLGQYSRDEPSVINNGNLVILMKIILLILLELWKNNRSNGQR